jgi:hypothetical protein
MRAKPNAAGSRAKESNPLKATLTVLTVKVIKRQVQKG